MVRGWEAESGKAGDRSSGLVTPTRAGLFQGGLTRRWLTRRWKHLRAVQVVEVIGTA